MATMGRPKKEINQEQFEKLCHIQCTQQEIANFFDCSIDTITNWCKSTYGQTFSDTYKKFADTGKMSLRRIQFKLAEKNTAMAIFLGKQYLGQRDNVEVSNTDELNKVKELLGKIEQEANK